MELIPVYSSNIKAIGYHELESTLFVEFKNGKRYAYYNVPEEVYNNLLNANSVGSYYHQNIKGKYNVLEI